MRNMNKKGLTLIELLGVIVLIATISLLVIPAVTSVINQSRSGLHNDQIHNMEEAASKWSLDYADFFDSAHLNAIYISLYDLKKGGYIALGKIEDPETRSEMNGCVQIIYNNETKKYNYNYYEEGCDDIINSAKHPTNLGYATYIYEDNVYKKKAGSNEKQSVGKAIYDYYAQNNNIRVLGEEVDGLYETDEYYAGCFAVRDADHHDRFCG